MLLMLREELNRQIGQRLKESREKAGHNNRQQFCADFGLSFSTFTKHELGIIGLSAASTIKYCEVLGISVEWLLTGNPSEAIKSK